MFHLQCVARVYIYFEPFYIFDCGITNFADLIKMFVADEHKAVHNCKVEGKENISARFVHIELCMNSICEFYCLGHRLHAGT